MRVTFDTNSWQRVVVPERFPGDPKRAEVDAIYHAILSARIAGFISETVVTLEAIPKRFGRRSGYLAKRAEDVAEVVHESATVDNQTGTVRVQGTIRLGGTSAAHPGLSPVLHDRLNKAFELGFRLLPSSRIGTARPAAIDQERYRIPLSEEQRADIWSHLDRIAEVADAIEARGAGFAGIQALARRIQQRQGLPNVPWYRGLDQPFDAAEEAEIDRAFAEWADGDTVSLHIAYGIDVLCTEDQARGNRNSIFSETNRRWLRDEFDITIVDLAGLAEMLRGD